MATSVTALDPETGEDEKEVQHLSSLGESDDADMYEMCNGYYERVLAGEFPGMTKEAFLEMCPIFANMLNKELPNIRVGAPGPDGVLFTLAGGETSLSHVLAQASSPMLLNFGSFT
jgi:hypothetical protein